MYLEPSAFNAFLSHIGQQVSWRPASACPCLNSYSGSPDPACPQCAGKGRIWGVASVGHVGVSGAKVQREWASFGLWEQGDIVLTLPSDSVAYAMNQYDRVLMLNTTVPFSQVLQAGETTLPHSMATVDRVFWLDPVTKAIVEGHIPTSVSAAGVMTFATGEAPPVDVQFSVSGRRHPEYFCYGEFAQDRAHHMGRDLPRRVVIRRFDLYGRG